jgi:hypothetical protein
MNISDERDLRSRFHSEEIKEQKSRGYMPSRLRAEPVGTLSAHSRGIQQNHPKVISVPLRLGIIGSKDDPEHSVYVVRVYSDALTLLGRP